MKQCILFAMLALASACHIYAEDTNTPSRAENIAIVDKTYQANLEKYQNNDNFLVRRGLLADKKKKLITLQGEATGIDEGKIVEFFLIGLTSGHDYEALALSFAKPSDVHQALEFIGLKPGRSTSSRDCLFWPKGERVFMTIDGTRVEKFALDDRTKAQTPMSGLVFIGSQMVPSSAVMAKKVYAADEHEPNSISSNYNDPNSVLDVPRRAPQKTVYGHNLMNSDMVIPKGKFLEITIEPEYKDGRQRVCDLTLELMANDQISITGDVAPATLDMTGLMQYLQTLLKSPRDPFVFLKFNNETSLSAIHTFCKTLSLLETDDGIRVEPPQDGELYYQAFFPPERFLNRKERTDQPLELTLVKQDSIVSGTLSHFEQIWEGDQIYPDLKKTDYQVSTPADLRATLDKVKSDIPAILVFVPGNLTYGELMPFIQPAISTHPLIHIFVEGTYQPSS